MVSAPVFQTGDASSSLAICSKNYDGLIWRFKSCRSLIKDRFSVVFKLLHGVIGNTTDFGSAVSGSSPGGVTIGES